MARDWRPALTSFSLGPVPPGPPGSVVASRESLLLEPRGIVRDEAGNVYVADFGNNRIAKFDVRLRFVTAWGQKGSAPGQFDNPCAVALGPDGELHVVDTWNNRIQVFGKDGTFLREFRYDFYGPRGIAVDARHRIYVVDTGHARVIRFSREGTKQLEWGKRGSRPGEFQDPVGITVDGKGTIYVCDNGNGRLQLFSEDGKFQRQQKVDGWKSAPLSEPNVAVDARGIAWVTVPLQKEVRGYDLKAKRFALFRSGEEWHRPFGIPLGIAIHPTFRSLLVSDDQGRLVPLSYIGKSSD